MQQYYPQSENEISAYVLDKNYMGCILLQTVSIYYGPIIATMLKNLVGSWRPTEWLFVSSFIFKIFKLLRLLRGRIREGHFYPLIP